MRRRPGNAGSNTAADHVEVFTQALAQLPKPLRRADKRGRVSVLVRTDAAGATQEFTRHIAESGIDPRWLDAARVVLAEHTQASTPTREMIVARIAARVETEHGPGAVALPSPTRARTLLRELAKGTSAFGSGKAKREIAGRPPGPSGHAPPGAPHRTPGPPRALHQRRPDSRPHRLTTALSAAQNPARHAEHNRPATRCEQGGRWVTRCCGDCP